MSDYPFHPKCEKCGSECARDYRLVLFRRTGEERREHQPLRVSGIYCNRCADECGEDKYRWGRNAEWVPDVIEVVS